MSGTFSNIVVVGGGLAGIAAACDLADAGLPVTLVEARPILGGKTWSFRDEQTGMPVDNGQHVFLGCCAAYLRFLQRLGIDKATRLQPRLHVPIFAAGQRPAVLEGTRFPCPRRCICCLRFCACRCFPGAKNCARRAPWRPLRRRAGAGAALTITSALPTGCERVAKATTPSPPLELDYPAHAQRRLRAGQRGAGADESFRRACCVTRAARASATPPLG